MQPFVAGHRGEAFLDGRQRPGGIPGLQPVGDEDEAGHDVPRIAGDDLRRHRHRRRPVVAAAEVDGRLQRPIARVGRVELEGARGMEGGGVGVLDFEGELGERGMGLGHVGPDLDEVLVLVEGVAGRTGGTEHRGVMQPCLGMVGIQAEDVAELDRRPLLVAVLEVGEGVLVVGLGAFGGTVAAGKSDGEEEGAEEGEAHGRTPGRRTLRSGRGTPDRGVRDGRPQPARRAWRARSIARRPIDRNLPPVNTA